MAFPSSPSNGQQAIVSNVTYQYNSAKTAWYRVGTVANPVTSTVDYYTGNGVQTTFSLSAVPSTEDYTFVAVGGVLQPRNTYSLSGSDLIFSGPPPNAAPVEITTFGGSGGSAYGNNNVGVYLTTYSGNIAAGNVLASGYFWANGQPFASSTYGNTDVAAYLPTSSIITGINANVAGANAAIITANSAVVSYVNTLNSIMASNVAGANAAIVTANSAMKTYVDSQVIAASGYSNVAAAAYLAVTNPVYVANIKSNTNIVADGNIIGGGVRSTASATAPINPVPGDIWFNTTDNLLYRYTSDGTTNVWFDISGPVYTFDWTSNVSFDGNLTPNANLTYYIGNQSQQYVSLYSANVFSTQTYTTGTATVGNIVTTNGVFWSNGNAYSSGSSGSSAATAYGLNIAFGIGL